MRQTFGWLVLLVGGLALGYWAQQSHAKTIEMSVRENAVSVDLTPFEKVVVSVSGRDVLLKGSVPTEDARDSVLAKMAVVDGVRTIHDQMDIATNN